MLGGCRAVFRSSPATDAGATCSVAVPRTCTGESTWQRPKGRRCMRRRLARSPTHRRSSGATSAATGVTWRCGPMARRRAGFSSLTCPPSTCALVSAWHAASSSAASVAPATRARTRPSSAAAHTCTSKSARRHIRRRAKLRAWTQSRTSSSARRTPWHQRRVLPMRRTCQHQRQRPRRRRRRSSHASPRTRGSLCASPM